MSDPWRRHKYAFNRILVPAARILSPEFNAAYLYFTGAHIELLRNLVEYANRREMFVDEYHEGYYISANDEDWDAISAIVAELEYMLMTIVLGFYDAYVCIRDVKEQAVVGGTFEQDAWRTRDLNDEHADTRNLASVASNQITLAAGTYRCMIVAPCYKVRYNRARLYNITDSEVALLGNTMYADATNNDYNLSHILGRFTIADTKVLEVQHYCTLTLANQGFGVASDIAEEIYTVVELWRET